MSETAPISLLTHISDSSSVSARSAARRGLGGHAPVRVRLQQRDREPLFFELFAGVEHRLVLGARAHDVPAARACAQGGRARHAEQRKVVSLGGAGGEDDLGRLRADQRRHLGARRFDALPRREAGAVRDGSRIAWACGSARHSAMAAATRGSTGVVAA